MEHAATTAILAASAVLAMFISAAALSMTLSLVTGWAFVRGLVRLAARRRARPGRSSARAT